MQSAFLDRRSRRVYIQFYHIWDNTLFFLKFQALWDAEFCTSKYCTSVAGSVIKQHEVTYWSAKSIIWSKISNWTCTILLLRSRFFFFILELTFLFAVVEKTSLWSVWGFVVQIPSHVGVHITTLSMITKFSKVRFFSSSLTEGQGKFRSFSFLVAPEKFGHQLRGQMFGFQRAEFEGATDR